MNYLPSEHQVLILSFQIIVMCISIIDRLQGKIFLDKKHMGMVGVEATLSKRILDFKTSAIHNMVAMLTKIYITKSIFV